MIFSAQSPITFADELPSHVDVVVIGAGVIGISTAYYLVRAGLSVLVCDKGRVAGEQSSRNWGWIRQQGRDPAELPIVIDSINAWESLSEDLDTDIGFTRQGVLYAAANDNELQQFEKWLDVAQQHQLDTRLVTGKQVDELVKDKPGQWPGGMYTPSDGRAEPFKAVPALARAVRKRGGLIRENCAVRSLDIEGGVVSGVVTEEGLVKAQSVLLAGGAWSSLFLANMGVALPQLTVRATVARTASAPDVYPGNASLAEVAIRRRQDGGYTIASSNTNEHFVGADSVRYMLQYLPALSASVRYIKLRFGDDVIKRLLPTRTWADDERTPFEQSRVLNPAPSQAAVKRMHAGLAKRLPSIAHLNFVETWAGMIDVTPDVVPVMDQIPQLPGCYLATGFSGHGFGIGPGAGQVMANMIVGKTAVHNLDRFRFARFSDGSKMRPGPGL